MATLSDILQERTRAGTLFEALDGRRLRCTACGHRCRLPDEKVGVCKVRFNRGGTLMVPFGYVSGVQSDPIEKKPFFHARPGSLAFSFGMLGCDLHCDYCQNWVTSQALRDPASVSSIRDSDPRQLVQLALETGSEIVVSTYNEPLITAEWAVAIFKEAKAAGLMTGFVSNGNATPEVLEYLHPWIDLFKVDLKTFDDRRYRRLGGRLKPVKETIQSLYRMGVWLEIVTLLVPGFNDSRQELVSLTEFIAGVSPEIPWHVTAFHQDYRMTGPDNTGTGDLLRATEVAKEAGLQFIYAGNLPGRLRELENTYCPECRTLLVERRGFQVLHYALTAGGRCPGCSHLVPGRWAENHGLPKSPHPRLHRLL